MRVISVHSVIRKPAFWVLIGTIMLPLNLLLAIAFWAQARTWNTEERARAARCLNIQLTYTPVFFVPILLASLFSSPAFRAIFPDGAVDTDVVGLALGLTALFGVFVLVFANTHAFACEVHDCEVESLHRMQWITTPLRIRFVLE